MLKGSDIMNKFCTSCGKPLEQGVKFCTGCGAAVPTTPAPIEKAADDISPKSNDFKSKVIEKMKSTVKKEAKVHSEKVFSDTIPSLRTTGEFTLPLDFTPFPIEGEVESLFKVLKNGLRSLVSGFKGTLRDKKMLRVVIPLTIIWLVVNVLAALDIFPLPVRLLSWLTFARGSLLGGTVGKGLVAAFLTQIFVDKGWASSLKRGLGQLSGLVKGSKEASWPLLLGLGLALIICNLMTSSYWQNTMVAVAGFVLSAKALTHNGFLQRLVTALLPKAKSNEVTTLMGGWALGFLLFVPLSLLPGGGNGYILGVIFLLGVVITKFMGDKKSSHNQEVTMK